MNKMYCYKGSPTKHTMLLTMASLVLLGGAFFVHAETLECPEDAGFSQPPAQSITILGWSSEIDSLRAYDNFSGVSGEITGMVWWGGGVVGGVECVRDPDTYEVSFYADNGGQPGALVASENFAASAITTELDAGFGTILKYEVTFETPVALSSGWVSVYGTGFAGCFFYWATGTGGNDMAYSSGAGSLATDFAFCLRMSSPEEGEGEPMTLEEIAEFLLEHFDEADTSEDGLLSFDEAQAVLPQLTLPEFNELDADGDEHLSKEELQAFLDDGRCGCCKQSDKSLQSLKGHLGDWLLVGVSMMVLLALTGAGKRP